MCHICLSDGSFLFKILAIEILQMMFGPCVDDPKPSSQPLHLAGQNLRINGSCTFYNTL